MNTKQIVQALCFLEKGSEQINVAQMTEAIGNLSEMLYLDSGGKVLLTLLANGKRRAGGKKGKRK